jgi:hypothetical protein
MIRVGEPAAAASRGVGLFLFVGVLHDVLVLLGDYLKVVDGLFHQRFEA